MSRGSRSLHVSYSKSSKSSTLILLFTCSSIQLESYLIAGGGFLVSSSLIILFYCSISGFTSALLFDFFLYSSNCLMTSLAFLAEISSELLIRALNSSKLMRLYECYSTHLESKIVTGFLSPTPASILKCSNYFITSAAFLTEISSEVLIRFLKDSELMFLFTCNFTQFSSYIITVEGLIGS